ncbi:MAG: FAD/NAD(P)-binding protein [Rickettsiales bacterium]|nr:FAD/NAD(P)-binding protein [Rickettsiales bacterium]
MSESVADIALVGGGFANVSALQRTVQEVQRQGLKLKPDQMHMRIYDVRHDFIGGGEAYGASSPGMMFNNVVRVMCYHGDNDKDLLLHKFYTWLHEDVDHWLVPLEAEAESHPALKRWLNRNAEKIRGNLKVLEDLFIPRVVMGQFLKEELYHTMQEAEALGIQVDLIEAEVEELQKNDDGTTSVFLSRDARKVNIEEHAGHITLSRGERSNLREVRATETVLGLGFAPRKRFPQLEKYERGPFKRYFSTQVSQKHDALMADRDPAQVANRADVIKESINHYYEANGRKVHIASIGTGPSFKDLLGVLADPEIRNKIKVVGYSNSAGDWVDPRHRFPHDEEAKSVLGGAVKYVKERVEPRDVRIAQPNDMKSRGYVKIRTNGHSEFYDIVCNMTPHLGPLHHPLIKKARDAGLCQTERVNGLICPKTNANYEISDGIYINGASAGKIMYENAYKDPGRESLVNVDNIAAAVSQDIVRRTKERLEHMVDHEEVAADSTEVTAESDSSSNVGNARYEGRLEPAERTQQQWLH